MLVESGPAKGDRNYFIFILIVCVAFVGWFFYDGSVGYIAKNRKEARKFLTGKVGAENLKETFGATPTDKEFEALRAAAPSEASELTSRWGAPFHSERRGNDVIDYYVSDYGIAEIPSRLGRIAWDQAGWTTWSKTKSEIDAQHYWALLPGAFALYALFRVYKAATLRVTIDEQGMTYGGKRIGFDQMVALRDYSPKGWVDLYHTADGAQRKLRLDNQKVDRFDQIIEVICMKKNFEDPRRSGLDEIEDAADDVEENDDTAHR